MSTGKRLKAAHLGLAPQPSKLTDGLDDSAIAGKDAEPVVEGDPTIIMRVQRILECLEPYGTEVPPEGNELAALPVERH